MDQKISLTKRENKPALLTRLLKQIFLIVLTLFLFFAFLWESYSFAELREDSVPKGEEVKDLYLEKLFAPEFPFESIKIIEAKGEEKYVIIKAKENITDEIQNRYEKETLRKRRITITRRYRVKDNTLAFSEITLYQVVSEVPYIVEFSNVKGKYVPGNKVDDVVRHEGQYLIIFVSEKFAKVFKKVVIYAEKEIPCPDPPFVGKYPGSKSIACYEGDKLITFVFVAKAKAQDIYDYYRDKLIAHYKEVGFNFPESRWKMQDLNLPQFGMKISTTHLPELASFLDLMRIIMNQDVTQTYHHGPEFRRLTKSSLVPMNG